MQGELTFFPALPPEKGLKQLRKVQVHHWHCAAVSWLRRTVSVSTRACCNRGGRNCLTRTCQLRDVLPGYSALEAGCPCSLVLVWKRCCHLFCEPAKWIVWIVTDVVWAGTEAQQMFSSEGMFRAAGAVFCWLSDARRIIGVPPRADANGSEQSRNTPPESNLITGLPPDLIRCASDAQQNTTPDRKSVV